MKFITKEAFTVLVIALLIGYTGGAVTSYFFFLKKPVIYNPSPLVHQRDSINAVLKDSVRYWKGKQHTAMTALSKQDSIINFKTAQYAKLRAKIRDANSDDATLLLEQFLSE